MFCKIWVTIAQRAALMHLLKWFKSQPLLHTCQSMFAAATGAVVGFSISLAQAWGPRGLSPAC